MIKQFLLLKSEYWDSLPPETRDRYIGGLRAFESGCLIGLTTAAVEPNVRFRTIFLISLLSGWRAAAAYFETGAGPKK